jgi:hypothetical protein
MVVERLHCTMRQACAVMRAAGGFYVGEERAENLRLTERSLEAWQEAARETVARREVLSPAMTLAERRRITARIVASAEDVSNLPVRITQPRRRKAVVSGG